MAGLQSIKNRISAIENIRKITHAMQLVATSKLRKAKMEYEHVYSYHQLVEETFKNIIEHMMYYEILNVFPKSQNPSKLYIVITGDLGLAGSYNSNVIKLAKKLIKKEDKVILIGAKSINSLGKKYENQILSKIHSETKETNKQLAHSIMTIAYEQYQNDEINSIHVIFNRYVNNLVQEEVDRKIFPFDIEEKEDHDLKFKQNLLSPIEFEPSAQEVLNESLPLYISAKIYTMLASAKLSEMASRRSAMENATDNANDLIENLNLKFNRKRQGKITQELNEIVAGADAV